MIATHLFLNKNAPVPRPVQAVGRIFPTSFLGGLSVSSDLILTGAGLGFEWSWWKRFTINNVSFRSSNPPRDTPRPLGVGIVTPSFSKCMSARRHNRNRHCSNTRGSGDGRRLPAPPPAAPPVYNWTGLYFGINGGGAWGQQDPFNILRNRFDHVAINYSGGEVGGTAGAQIQVAHVVLGFEADLIGRNWRVIKSHSGNFRQPARSHGQCQYQLGTDGSGARRMYSVIQTSRSFCNSLIVA